MALQMAQRQLRINLHTRLYHETTFFYI